jgi:dephospho-CoA kinase
MDHKTNIIGLAGTNGSGKDTVGKILADKYGYMFVSVTDLLREEVKRRHQPVEREVLRQLSADWRRKDGLGVLVDRALQEYEKTKSNYKGLVMASLRNPGEVERLHELDGLAVWIDADPRIRYKRIQKSIDSRGRAEEDNKTFEQFLNEESIEMNTPIGGDEANLNMSGVKALSDVFINNEGDDIDEFEKLIKQTLNI